VARYWSWVVRLVTVSATAAIVLATAAGAATGEPRRIVVLHSYGQNFKPWSEYAKALRQELERTSQWPLDVQEFSVITARSEDENAEIQFAEYLGALYANHAPDLIVAFGAPAGAFVQRYRAQLFPNKPMILTAIDQRRVQQDALTENDTVVEVRQDVGVLFGNILRLLPDTKTVIVVIGNSPNERFWIDVLQRDLQPLKDRVQFVFFNDLSLQEILKRAASLPPNSAIWWNQPHVDGVGAVHEGEHALKALYSVANAPIFSYDDSFFGGEIVGGPMTSVSDGASATSKVVTRILAGEKPADIKTPTLEYGPPKYDWRQLMRWGIPTSRLPPDSEIYFREPNAWQTYRWQILLVLTVILAQAALITILVNERRGRLRAEVQTRRRSAELAHINRYSLAGEMTASIAHELNQPLGSILTNAETAELILQSSTPNLSELREIVADIRRDDERASEVILRLRSLLKNAPFELTNIDLNELVRETTGFLSALAIGRKVDLDSVFYPVPLPIRGDRIQLQQVLINLVVNAIDAMSTLPNGQYRNITVSTSRIDEFAEISVSDTGPGIALDRVKEVFEAFFTTKSQGMGLGLAIARTIVEAHNGRIWAENQASGGAVLRIRLPLLRIRLPLT
jgi:signal transduction histidine kinase